MSFYYGVPLLLGSAGALFVGSMFEEEVTPPVFGSNENIPYGTAVNEEPDGFFGEETTPGPLPQIGEANINSPTSGIGSQVSHEGNIVSESTGGPVNVQQTPGSSWFSAGPTNITVSPNIQAAPPQPSMFPSLLGPTSSEPSTSSSMFGSTPTAPATNLASQGPSGPPGGNTPTPQPATMPSLFGTAPPSPAPDTNVTPPSPSPAVDTTAIPPSPAKDTNVTPPSPSPDTTVTPPPPFPDTNVMPRGTPAPPFGPRDTNNCPKDVNPENSFGPRDMSECNEELQTEEKEPISEALRIRESISAGPRLRLANKSIPLESSPASIPDTTIPNEVIPPTEPPLPPEPVVEVPSPFQKSPLDYQPSNKRMSFPDPTQNDTALTTTSPSSEIYKPAKPEFKASYPFIRPEIVDSSPKPAPKIGLQRRRTEFEFIGNQRIAKPPSSAAGRKTSRQRIW